VKSADKDGHDKWKTGLSGSWEKLKKTKTLVWPVGGGEEDHPRVSRNLKELV